MTFYARHYQRWRVMSNWPDFMLNHGRKTETHKNLVFATVTSSKFTDLYIKFKFKKVQVLIINK